MPRRTFSREFKLEAVRRVTEEGRSLRSVAQELDIDRGLLSRWKTQLERDVEEAFPGKGRLKPSDDRVRELERENRRLREENEFLKKTAAYFAKDSRGGSK